MEESKAISIEELPVLEGAPVCIEEFVASYHDLHTGNFWRRANEESPWILEKRL